jgi:hypothetical protein
MTFSALFEVCLEQYIYRKLRPTPGRWRQLGWYLISKLPWLSVPMVSPQREYSRLFHDVAWAEAATPIDCHPRYFG